MNIEFRKKQDPEIIQYLKNVPLFSALNDKTIKAIIRDSREVNYPSGKVILREGEQSVVFHVILSGGVEIVKKGKHLSQLGSGEFFGEMGLFTGEARSADVIAIEPTRCLALTAWSFRSFLRHNPSIAFEVIRTLALRLSEKDSIKAQTG
ncbi:MAG: cyclic nucleotide-binding domain-containing protein [Nitrososphaerales archaeon]